MLVRLRILLSLVTSGRPKYNAVAAMMRSGISVTVGRGICCRVWAMSAVKSWVMKPLLATLLSIVCVAKAEISGELAKYQIAMWVIL